MMAKILQRKQNLWWSWGDSEEKVGLGDSMIEAVAMGLNMDSCGENEVLYGIEALDRQEWEARLKT